MKEFDTSLYYDLNKVKSHNKFINMVISQRGVGKSFAMKREAVTRFIKGKGQFVYIRRTGTQLKQIRDGDSKGGKFFTDIQEFFPDHELDYRADKFYCNGEVMGYSVALTKPAVVRGASFHNVTTIWFDEFISIGTPDDIYRPNEFNDFLNICDTIIRTRSNVKIYMLGNPYSLVNPYFNEFNIDLKIGERLTVYKDIIIDFFDAKDFASARTETAFGRIIQGTAYGTFSLDNQSLVDSDAFIHARTRTSDFLFNLEYRNKGVSVFYDSLTDLYYCSDMINQEYKGKIVFEERLIDDVNKYASHFKDDRRLFMIKMAFDLGKIYYDSQKIKSAMFKMYKKVGIIK